MGSYTTERHALGLRDPPAIVGRWQTSCHPAGLPTADVHPEKRPVGRAGSTFLAFAERDIRGPRGLPCVIGERGEKNPRSSLKQIRLGLKSMDLWKSTRNIRGNHDVC